MEYGPGKLLVPTSHVINPSIYAKLPYNTVNDFAPNTMVASTAILMAVHSSAPADTVRCLIEGRQDPPADDRELRICATIRRGLGGGGRADRAACVGAIVDHNRLAQNFVELLPEHATQDV